MWVYLKCVSLSQKVYVVVFPTQNLISASISFDIILFFMSSTLPIPPLPGLVEVATPQPLLSRNLTLFLAPSTTIMRTTASFRAPTSSGCYWSHCRLTLGPSSFTNPVIASQTWPSMHSNHLCWVIFYGTCVADACPTSPHPQIVISAMAYGANIIFKTILFLTSWKLIILTFNSREGLEYILKTSPKYFRMSWHVFNISPKIIIIYCGINWSNLGSNFRSCFLILFSFPICFHINPILFRFQTQL